MGENVRQRAKWVSGVYQQGACSGGSGFVPERRAGGGVCHHPLPTADAGCSPAIAAAQGGL